MTFPVDPQWPAAWQFEIVTDGKGKDIVNCGERVTFRDNRLTYTCVCLERFTRSPGFDNESCRLWVERHSLHLEEAARAKLQELQSVVQSSEGSGTIPSFP